jgi:hypothetical protein
MSEENRPITAITRREFIKVLVLLAQPRLSFRLVPRLIGPSTRLCPPAAAQPVALAPFNLPRARQPIRLRVRKRSSPSHLHAHGEEPKVGDQSQRHANVSPERPDTEVGTPM